jgi:transcriptional regulator with XRE-family HTH domain
MIMLTGEQVRAARALLSWSEEKLAEEARLSLDTVRQFEQGGSATRLATSDVLRRALESAGAEFIAENGSVCVHYRKDPAEEGTAAQAWAGEDDGIRLQELRSDNDD